MKRLFLSIRIKAYKDKKSKGTLNEIIDMLLIVCLKNKGTNPATKEFNKAILLFFTISKVVT